MRFEDLTGIEFETLTVIKRIPSSNHNAKWLLRCKCGRERKMFTQSIKRKPPKCCLCAKIEELPNSFVDMKDKKLGCLTVIERNGTTYSNQPLWKCVCDCKEIVHVTTQRLKREQKYCKYCKGNNSLKDNHYKWRGCGDISGSKFNGIRNGAIRRGLEFNITIEYLWELFIKQNRKCAVSGKDICFAKSQVDDHHGCTTASLDRINSKLGYVVGNVQWVHKKINMIKCTLSQEELIEWCHIISKYNQDMNNDRNQGI